MKTTSLHNRVLSQLTACCGHHNLYRGQQGSAAGRLDAWVGNAATCCRTRLATTVAPCCAKNDPNAKTISDETTNTTSAHHRKVSARQLSKGAPSVST